MSKVEERKKVASQLAWFIFWVGVTVFGLVLAPSPSLHGTHQQLGLPACPSVLFFDRPCLGCGMTTSVAALLHGDFATSFAAHPFGAPLYLLFTVSALAGGWGWAKRTRIDTGTRNFQRALMVVVVLFVAHGAVRFTTVKYGSKEFARARHLTALSTGEQRR